MKQYTNYNNTGYENISFDDKKREIAELFNEKDIITISELQGGFLNKVYKLKFKSNIIVLKLSPTWSSNGLYRENWCYNLFKEKTNIKTPSVFLYLPQNNSIFPKHELFFIEYIQGNLLNENDFNDSKLNEKLNQIFEQIWSFPMENFGWLNENLKGNHSTWFDFLITSDNIETVQNSKILPTNDIEFVFSEFQKYDFQNISPKLLHGDFKWSNFIRKDNDIYSIDFQNCFAGHHLYDLGIGVFFQPLLFTNLTYYTQENNDSEYKLILLYSLRHCLSVLGHRLTVADNLGVIDATKRFEFLLKKYLKYEL